MSTFAQLTSDQQSQLLAFMLLFRPNTGQLARTLDTLRKMDDYWNNNAKAINALLDAGIVVPDNTGLAGATTLTKDNLITIMNAIETLLATYNTGPNRGLMANIAGATNITS